MKGICVAQDHKVPSSFLYLLIFNKFVIYLIFLHTLVVKTGLITPAFHKLTFPLSVTVIDLFFYKVSLEHLQSQHMHLIL